MPLEKRSSSWDIMKNHSNISVFIPHLGCPHRCSFCDQNSISGTVRAPSPEEIEKFLKDAVSKLKMPERTEIAFFGGSFTAVSLDYQSQLLKIAAHYVRDCGLSGIRISTRPDAIDIRILKHLKQYPVHVIELGAQSMDDRVLALNKRGHTSDDVRNACTLIKRYGFQLGLQMMTGLYESNFESDFKTAEELISLEADMVRIYPTLVLKGTYLERLYRSGCYFPPDLETAVSECAKIYSLFISAEIPVIRLGLHASTELESRLVAGPYHPAFKELCEGSLMLENVKRLLNGKPKGKVFVAVAEKSRSKMVGHHHRNLRKLKEDGYEVNLVSDPCLEKYQVKLL